MKFGGEVMYYNRKSSQVKQIAILVLLILIWAVLYFLPLGDDQAVGDNVASATDNQDEPQMEQSGDPLDLQAGELLSQMSVEQKVAQMFIITPEDLTGVARVTVAGGTTQAALSEFQVGGLVYGSSNIVSPEQISTMIANTQTYAREAGGLSLFACIDEQGGGASQLAGNENFGTVETADLSSLTSRDEAYEVGNEIGAYLNSYGFNVDFAPLGNLLYDLSDIQSFGSNPDTVGFLADGMAQGLIANGVLATMKYFPALEGTAASEKTLEQLQSSDLVPFASAIEQNIPLIMVGHVTMPQIATDNVPSSLSKAVVTDLLKGDLDYQGLVVSDALNKETITAVYSSDQAAIKAIQAGNDMLLMPEEFTSAYQGVLAAIDSGEISIEQIDQSVTKIIKAKLQLES